MNKNFENKQEKKNLPAIFEYKVGDISYKIPDLFKGANQREFNRIKKACDESFGDRRGQLYINSKYLDCVLRTKSFVAKEILFEMNSNEKIKCGNDTFVRLGEIMKFITRRLETLPCGKTRNYLLSVEKFLLNIRDSDKFVNIRTMIEADYKDELKKLKTKRKRKLKNDGIKIFIDELTGEKLKRGSEFSHIRAKSVYPEFALNIDNGLLINKETHEIITSRSIVNEDELLDLCKENKWNTRWYIIFSNIIN